MLGGFDSGEPKMKSICTGLFAAALGCVFIHSVSAADAVKAREKVLYAFCSQQYCTDGDFPQASLIDVKGTLYGTTVYGGRNDDCRGYACDTVFALDPNTGAEKVLYSFCSLQNCADGSEPFARLIDVNGTLYGTTYEGGTSGTCPYGCGTVFSLDPKTGAEKVVYSFCSQPNCTDGADPYYAGLIDVKGTLYGTTISGGDGATYQDGTVFAIDPNTGAEKVLYSFCNKAHCADGAAPYAGLIDVNGTLYGITEEGGTSGTCQYGCGAVFSVDPKTGAEAVVYSFCSLQNCTDGTGPTASGLIAVQGVLYGTTGGGGSDNKGTVFALDPKTGAETVVYSFTGYAGGDGQLPYAGVIDAGGTLYGTTVDGGLGACFAGGCGTVFSVNPATGAEAVLHSFRRRTKGGTTPYTGLIAVRGVLYGMASDGGAHGGGTVFAIKHP